MLSKFKDLEPKTDPKGGDERSHVPSWSHYKPPHHNGGLLAAAAKQVVSFLLGMLVAAFVFGGKTQQFIDLLEWKKEVNAKLERMDTEGTRASKNALINEAKDLGRYEGRLEKLEDQARKIDTLTLKMEENTKALEELRSTKSR